MKSCLKIGVILYGNLLCANEDEASAVRKALDEHIRLTREEPGCILFEVIETSDPLVWDVTEEFTDPNAFEAHQARSKTSLWATKTKGIRRQYRIKGMV